MMLLLLFVYVDSFNNSLKIVAYFLFSLTFLSYIVISKSVLVTVKKQTIFLSLLYYIFSLKKKNCSYDYCHIYIYYAVCMYLLYKEEIKTTTTTTFSVYDLTFHLFPIYLKNFILQNASNLQTNLLCHCVMFICVMCHVTRAMWPFELVFIINIYIYIYIYKAQIHNVDNISKYTFVHKKAHRNKCNKMATH